MQPAFAKLLEFMDREYLPASYDGIGWWRTSSGLAGYRYFAKYHTTTDMAPQDIHALGLKEVARIRGEMEAIKKQVGFTGTLEQFFTHLRTDPKFFYKTGEELLDGYRVVAKRIDPELIKISRKLPRTPYGVIQIPDALAPMSPTAFANGGAPDGSRPAYFFANLYKPETRPKWEMMALTLHEAMPGHCLQISTAQELGELPQFRRHAFFTAYVEGWGLYAESLGEDMGLYKDDPYSKFGQLTYEMWRAVRLVVDTGMHAMEWDRERAIKYFMDNAAKTENDVTTEIDRYISVPGQALAYKIGELKIKELRRRSEKALGDKFDLRDFNDVVLQSGALPLNILEERVNEWLGESNSNEKRRTKSEHRLFSFFVFRFSFSRYNSKPCQCPFPSCSDFDDVISRRQRSEGNLGAPPSCAVRVFANRRGQGHVQRIARASQQPRRDVGAERDRRLDDEPFCAAESKVGGRHLTWTDPPEEERPRAERIRVEREDGRLGRAKSRHAFRTDYDFVIVGLERRSRRNGNLRRERPGRESRASLRDRLAGAVHQGRLELPAFSPIVSVRRAPRQLGNGSHDGCALARPRRGGQHAQRQLA